MAITWKALPEATTCEETEIAQRFLAGAYDSVAGVLDSLDKVRELRRQETGDIRGRLAGSEEDLLRAAVVFAGAGLDATLKQTVRDALPALLEVSDQAHDKFEAFVVRKVSIGDAASPQQVGALLASPDPRGSLIEDYVFELTGSSLQSAEEVDKTASALGIDDATLRQRIRNMRPAFMARNEISHELDLQQVQKQGDRSKRTRALKETVGHAHETLVVGQLILNAVYPLLYEPDGE